MFRRMRSGGIKVTKHSKPFQIAPRREDNLHFAFVGFLQNLARSGPKQHPVFGLVNGRQRRRVASINEIKARIENPASIFMAGRPPARPWDQLLKIGRPAKAVADRLKAVAAMQRGTGINAVGCIRNTGKPKR